MRSMVFRTLFIVSVALSAVTPMAVFAASSAQTAMQPPAGGVHGEFCPARVVHWALQSDGILALELGANHARRVRGQLEMQTDAGWFRARLPATGLQRRVDHYTGPGGIWTRSLTRSSPLYIQLPSTVHSVKMVWTPSLSSLDMTGDWSHLGPIACAPQMPEIAGPVFARSEPNDIDVHQALSLSPVASTYIIPSQRIDDPHFPCKNAFTEPELNDPSFAQQQPRWLVDELANVGVVYVGQRISINAAGDVVDTRILRSSNEMGIDAWVKQSLRRMEFHPAMAFCRAVPGQYPFWEVFRSQ